CNTDWLQYQLGDGERWPISGSLNYSNLLQLDLLCQRQMKWNEIPCVQFFMAFYRN
ncbi:hypothetical protein DBR06_SOUSAS10610030, partial [Sousa chinensis]